MKKGITIMAVSTIITVIIILTTVVIISASNINETTNKTKFVVEVLNIQDEIKAYKVQHGTYPTAGNIDMDLSDVSQDAKKQFFKETVSGDKVYLNMIDYTLINIKDRIFGNNKDEKDIYVFSEKTGIVYYVHGIKYKGKIYYTVTEEISDTNQFTSNLKANEIKKSDVIFEMSNISYTKSPIYVNVKLPNRATDITVTSTNGAGISEEFNLEGYKVISINKTTLIQNNYDISVTYNLSGNVKNVNYSVNNFDNILPVINVDEKKITMLESYSGTESKKYLTGIKVTDDLSGVKEIKYELENINDTAYFKNYGTSYNDNKIEIMDKNYCTIYAIDNAGNESIEVINLSEVP